LIRINNILLCAIQNKVPIEILTKSIKKGGWEYFLLLENTFEMLKICQA